MHDATPKLSPALFTAFKAYKRDTDRLATWLGDTARSIGFDIDRPPAAAAAAAPHTGVPPGAPTPRLKGKARKAAKEQAAQKSAAAANARAPRQGSGVGADPEIPGPTCISVSQFIACAQFIADSDPPVLVPTRVIDWACRAIKARRMCADWFQSPATTAATAGAGSQFNDDNPDSTTASNRTHAYFIAVLEEVAAILAPRVGTPTPNTSSPASPPRASKPSPPATPVDLLESRFAALDVTKDDADADSNWDAVFDLVAETLNSKPASPSMSNASSRRNKLSKPNRAKLESDHLRRLFRLHCDENDDDEQEFVFALMEHLESLEMVSGKVTDVWRAYLRGHLHYHSGSGALEHASLVTMVVSDKVQAMTLDLTTKYPALMRNYAKYARLIFEHACADFELEPWAAASADTSSGGGGGATSVFGHKTWKLATFCYLPMITVLERFRKAVQADCVRRTEKPDDISCGCCHADENKQRDQLELMEALVNELWLTYQEAEKRDAGFAGAHFQNPAIDALTSLKSLPLSEPIPLFTLFAVQQYFSIGYQLDLLDSALSSAFIRADVQFTLAPHLSAYKHHLRYPPSTPTSNELYLRNITEVLNQAPMGQYLWLADNFNFDHTGSPVDAAADLKKVDEHGMLTTAHLKARQTAIFRLFAVHPWLAGMVVVRAGLCMSQIAVRLADPWQSVLNGAYLFEAMRLMGLDRDGKGNQSCACCGDHLDDEDSDGPSSDTSSCAGDADACGADASGAEDERGEKAAGPKRSIRDTLWWRYMSEFLAIIGKSRVFYGKAPSDMHSLWRTLNLTLENRSRTDLVFRDHLQPRNGRAGALPHSLRRIVSKHACKPQSKGIVTLLDLFDKRRKEIVGDLMVDRLSMNMGPQVSAPAHIKAVVSSLEQIVSARIKPADHEVAGHLEYESARNLSMFVDQVSDDLRAEFVRLLLPNLLMLHVYSVRILKHLREQVLVGGRIEMMNEDCKGCRWRDSTLPAALWNLIRALGGEEVTERVLGLHETMHEKEDAVALMVDIKKYIVEMRETTCTCDCDEHEE